MSYRLALILTLAVVLNAGFALLQLWLLRRRTPWPKWLGFGVIAWNSMMLALFFLHALAPTSWLPFIRKWFFLPMAVEMVWNVLLLELLFLGSILLVLALRWLQPNNSAPAPLTSEGISRRQFLFAAAYSAAPVAAIGMGVHGTLTHDNLRVRTLPVPVNGLPPELEGFTIAHVSDLHSGLFVGPERLKIISDATNDLKPDLITITGDLINREMEEFPAALTAMKAMESRYGLFLCEGNHDLIPGPGVLMDACMENNLPMLAFGSVLVPVENRRLMIAGLPWMKTPFEGMSGAIDKLYPARQEGDVRVLLAHHPHLFDAADSVDLVLAGHTHGGQIMLDNQVGLGPMFFRYWSGLYQRGHTSLVVSNGAGDWFPCRIGAPAEIVLVKLTAVRPGALVS